MKNLKRLMTFFICEATPTSHKISTPESENHGALSTLEKIWNSRVTTETKVRIFKSTINSILLYGCESWVMANAAVKKFDGTYTRLLRRVKNVSKVVSRNLVALTISVLLGKLMLMSRSLLGSGMTDGSVCLSVSLKCFAYRALYFSSPRMMFSSLSFTGRLRLLFLPESVLVVPYRRFLLRWPAGLSASAVNSSMYVFFLS